MKKVIVVPKKFKIPEDVEKTVKQVKSRLDAMRSDQERALAKSEDKKL